MGNRQTERNNMIDTDLARSMSEDALQIAPPWGIPCGAINITSTKPTASIARFIGWSWMVEWAELIK